MDTVLRSFAIYVVLWALLRLSGRRTLGELTAFDFILLLIIGGATQRALLGQDYSVTNALLVVITLVFTDVVLSLLQREFPPLSRLINGAPMIIVAHGRAAPPGGQAAPARPPHRRAVARIRPSSARAGAHGRHQIRHLRGQWENLHHPLSPCRDSGKTGGLTRVRHKACGNTGPSES